MRLKAYGHVFAVPMVRLAIGIGFLFRFAQFSMSVILTLYVAEHMQQGYGKAGLVIAAFALSASLTAPWWGRLIDRIGLRTPLLIAVTAELALGASRPFVSYEWLLVVCAASGLLGLPTMGIIRQMVMAYVSENDQRTALSLDAIGTELSYIIGPALSLLGVAAFGYMPVMLSLTGMFVVAGLWFYVLNPRLTRNNDHNPEPLLHPVGSPESLGPIAEHPTPTLTTPRRRRRGPLPAWLGVTLGTVLVVIGLNSMTFAGHEIVAMASIRSMEYGQSVVAAVLMVWGVGSMVGAVVYGMLPRSLPLPLLALALGAGTMLYALSSSLWTACVFISIAGLLCAPTITSSTETLRSLTPDKHLTEAMGWQSSIITLAISMGNPIVGWMIDGWGWHKAVLGLGMLPVLGGLILALVYQARLRAQPA